MRAHSRGTRVLMIVVGCLVLVTYLGLAFLWRSAPDPTSTAANGRGSKGNAPGSPHKRFWQHAP